MNIWKLSVTDSNSPNWEASTYKGDVIARAKNEHDARMVTTHAFVIATERRTGEHIKFCPWMVETDTSCELLENSEYTIKGESGVLSPIDT